LEFCKRASGDECDGATGLEEQAGSALDTSDIELHCSADNPFFNDKDH
jgi:hypothetical protein